MQKSSLLGRLMLLLLLVFAVAAGACYWLYVAERDDNVRLRGELDRARDLKGRLGEMGDVLTRMRTNLDGVIDRMTLSKKGVPAKSGVDDELTATALRDWAGRVDQENKSLAKDLTDARSRLDTVTKARQDFSARLNQANVDLARVNKQLDGKTKEAGKLAADLKKKETESASRAGDVAAAKKSLAEVKGALAALTKTRQGLESRVKTLTDAESQAKAEVTKLAGELKLLKEDHAKVKKLAAELARRVKELEALIEKMKQTRPADPVG